MPKTFTLYLKDEQDQTSSFEPALCGGDEEAVAKARELLERHPECQAVDVYFGEVELFRVKQRRG